MRAQATIEFLVTYGWAIFALIIVLGALLSTGILSPNYLVSEECTFGTNIQCNFALYNEGDSTVLDLQLFNAFPYAIKINTIEMETQAGDLFSLSPENKMLESGAYEIFSAEIGESVEDGSIRRFSGTINYVSCAPELGEECGDSDHVITGRVIGKIIPQ